MQSTQLTILIIPKNKFLRLSSVKTEYKIIMPRVLLITTWYRHGKTLTLLSDCGINSSTVFNTTLKWISQFPIPRKYNIQETFTTILNAVTLKFSDFGGFAVIRFYSKYYSIIALQLVAQVVQTVNRHKRYFDAEIKK